MSKNIVFVIGAARSGTHLVGSSIATSLNSSQYLAEINEFWNKYNRNYDSDIIDAITFSNEKLKIKIRREFLALLNDECKFHIEKTAANSLRVDFLFELFPNAKFVHVVRDGTSVVNSVMKKVSGDPRKITITNNSPINLTKKIQFLINRFKEKVSSETFSIWYLLKNFSYYKSIALSVFGVKSKGYWGPRFTVSPLKLGKKEYATAQWQYCLKKARKDLINIEHIEIDFNEIINNPKSVADKLSLYLWEEKIKFEIDESILKVR